MNKLPGLGWVLFFLAVSPVACGEELDDLKQNVQASQKALEELKASREKLEDPASVSDRAALDQLKEKVSRQAEDLDRTLEELQPKSPEEELCFSATRGDVEAVKRLLHSGAHPDARDRFGGSAIEAAANGGFTEIVKLLIQRGADVNSKGMLGGTPLILAAAKGHLETVSALLEARADVNAQAETGVTALIGAKINGHKAVVELLKKAGAKK